MPRDYTSEQWSVVRQRIMAQQASKEGKAMHDRALTEYPKSHKQVAPTVDDLAQMLGERLRMRVRRPEDQYHNSYKLFGFPRDGVSKEHLAERMKVMGIVATKEQIDELFSRFDLNKNNKIEFTELISAVMPKDWTEELWNTKADDERRRREAEARKAMAQETPFGFDKIPGWHGMKSFGIDTMRDPLPPSSRSEDDSASRYSELLDSARAPRFGRRSRKTGRRQSGRGATRPSGRFHASSSIGKLPRAVRNHAPAPSPVTSRSGVRRGLTLSSGARGPDALRKSRTVPNLAVDTARR